MKNIICIIGDNIPNERKLQIINLFKKNIHDLKLPFSIDLFSPLINTNNYHYAITCFPPKGIILKFNFLELVLSLNVGVDDVINEINENTHLCRIIHEPAITRISQYTLYCIMDFILLMDKYRENQLLKSWDRTKPLSIVDDQIGIMGLGNVGFHIATILEKINKSPIGYSRTIKSFIKNSFISNEFDLFLSKTNILINALPLDKSTRGILNKDTFDKLPDNSCIINIGRGDHIVENDLLDALESNKLKKVYLDVFSVEPLPATHPFWSHKKIFITPHISGAFDIVDIIKPAIKQLKLFYDKGILINEVHN